MRLIQTILKVIRWFFWIIGFIFFIFIILSLTDLPYCAYHRLGTAYAPLNRKPGVIVLLGGSGMPSPDGLMRTWQAAEAAIAYPDALIIIANSSRGDESHSQLKLMARELEFKGIDSTRILFEPFGYNTRSQAVNISKLLINQKDTISVLLVTSPEHMYRSVKTFQKAGFIHVGGAPAFEKPIDEESAADRDIEGNLRVRSLDIRYNMWNYLKYELIVLREYSAIVYYELKGWI